MGQINKKERNLMKYKIYESRSAKTLETSVNEALAKGWELYGPLKVTKVSNDFNTKDYTQVLIKK